MYKLIQEYKKGNTDVYPQIEKMFHPLIFSWLKKIKHLHSQEKEDYLSQSKLILIECLTAYNPTYNVPFESYYKIKLYHWYSNHYRKKKCDTIPISETSFSIEDILIEKERREQMLLAIEKLTETEKVIMFKYIEGYTTKEIAEELNMNTKTVINKKNICIDKIRNYLFIRINKH